MADTSLSDTLIIVFILAVAGIAAVTFITIFIDFGSFVDVTVIETISRDVNTIMMRTYSSNDNMTIIYDPIVDEEANYTLMIAPNDAGTSRLKEGTIIRILETDRHGEEHIEDERMPYNFSSKVLVRGSLNEFKINNLENGKLEFKRVVKTVDSKPEVFINIKKV